MSVMNAIYFLIVFIMIATVVTILITILVGIVVATVDCMNHLSGPLGGIGRRPADPQRDLQLNN